MSSAQSARSRSGAGAIPSQRAGSATGSRTGSSAYARPSSATMALLARSGDLPSSPSAKSGGGGGVHKTTSELLASLNSELGAGRGDSRQAAGPGHERHTARQTEGFGSMTERRGIPLRPNNDVSGAAAADRPQSARVSTKYFVDGDNRSQQPRHAGISSTLATAVGPISRSQPRASSASRGGLGARGVVSSSSSTVASLRREHESAAAIMRELEERRMGVGLGIAGGSSKGGPTALRRSTAPATHASTTGIDILPFSGGQQSTTVVAEEKAGRREVEATATRMPFLQSGYEQCEASPALRRVLGIGGGAVNATITDDRDDNISTTNKQETDRVEGEGPTRAHVHAPDGRVYQEQPNNNSSHVVAGFIAPKSATTTTTTNNTAPRFIPSKPTAARRSSAAACVVAADNNNNSIKTLENEVVKARGKSELEDIRKGVVLPQTSSNLGNRYAPTSGKESTPATKETKIIPDTRSAHSGASYSVTSAALTSTPSPASSTSRGPIVPSVDSSPQSPQRTAHNEANRPRDDGEEAIDTNNTNTCIGGRMERRHSGRYVHHYPQKGHYVCAMCRIPLLSCKRKVLSVGGYATFTDYFQHSVDLEVIVPHLDDDTFEGSFVGLKCVNCSNFFGRMISASPETNTSSAGGSEEADGPNEDNDIIQVNSCAILYLDRPPPPGFEDAVDALPVDPIAAALTSRRVGRKATGLGVAGVSASKLVSSPAGPFGCESRLKAQPNLTKKGGRGPILPNPSTIPSSRDDDDDDEEEGIRGKDSCDSSSNGSICTPRSDQDDDSEADDDLWSTMRRKGKQSTTM